MEGAVLNQLFHLPASSRVSLHRPQVLYKVDGFKNVHGFLFNPPLFRLPGYPSPFLLVNFMAMPSLLSVSSEYYELPLFLVWPDDATK